MTIGFIGLGLMGSAMCSNLIKKSGAEILVYDVNPAASEQMQKEGAAVALSAAEIAQSCEIIITMVPKSEHVIAVYEELLPMVREGQLLIDMSTIAPEVSKGLAEKVQNKGADMIDAPVVKSRPAAIAGVLGIYVGGSRESFLRAEPYLACMGSNMIHLGGNGSGLVMKLCHNALVAQIQNGVNETMTLAGRAGDIDPETFAKAISYGGGQNFYLDSKAGTIAKHDFSVAFSVQNMDKDVHLAKELADQCFTKLQGVELSCIRYEEAVKQGFGAEDFSATYKLFE